MPDYKYDVAISFCYEDENLALAIKDALKGLDVFVFSKAQEDLAGTDGMQSFIDTFKSESRVVVVLHRDKWGTTKWTKVEENAIKDFCLNGGWDRLFLVRTAASSRLPKWIPDTHLYFDLVEFAFEELIGAIKARAKERGSRIEPESAASKGRRMAERHAFEAETLGLMRSIEGVEQSTEAVERMVNEISTQAAEISEAGISIACGGGPTHFVMRADGVGLILNWQHYINSIEDSPLQFRIFRGTVLLPSERGRRLQFRDPVVREQFSILIDRTRAVSWCMRESEESEALSPERTAELILSKFLDAYDRLKKEPIDDDW